jgi:hypothetical protein
MMSHSYSVIFSGRMEPAPDAIYKSLPDRTRALDPCSRIHLTRGQCEHEVMVCSLEDAPRPFLSLEDCCEHREGSGREDDGVEPSSQDLIGSTSARITAAHNPCSCST